MILTGVVLDAPDANELAAFYRRLLGWDVLKDEPNWVMLSAPGGGPGLSFQTASLYRRPVWPPGPDDPPTSMHLDIQVDDLDEAERHAAAAGATLADYQPQDGVRVYIDPDGHPFCLYI
jgi:catechol 2,3-dioxygenase-like lactoylglutathione lyase family enzyme